jgi:beta-glucanase (GH16 family)
MLPVQPDYPKEVDVFEMLGRDPTTIYMSNHWNDQSQEHQKNIVSFEGPDFSTEFHTFSLRWTPNLLIWYVDGVEQYRTNDGVPTQPMFLLINLAVGGKWPGNPDETTVFPSSMEIDYVLAYKYLCNLNTV